MAAFPVVKEALLCVFNMRERKKESTDTNTLCQDATVKPNSTNSANYVNLDRVVVQHSDWAHIFAKRNVQRKVPQLRRASGGDCAHEQHLIALA